MAPRRGGAAGAGVEASSTSSLRGGLAPPPLKRIQPWLEDGSGQCDIVAGGVDATGVFKGIYVSGVHLTALLRTFQLSKTFLPVEMPTPVQTLGQSLQDGIPLVIITRGCFGREMDIGSGPARNNIQKAVWEAARNMRADMPQVLVSCIDIPVDASPEVVNACLQPPSNNFRELMYHVSELDGCEDNEDLERQMLQFASFEVFGLLKDGTWYTPAVYNASKLAQWVSNNPREIKPKEGPSFSRKKFEWNNKAYDNMFMLGWKSVLEVRPPTLTRSG
ncbi:unnamed protein product [Durusdinium trenchii]|uniref:Uncharacterized protein n=1 Tax=Durusdinium trenchii TaxID=1381693 RepID=A0ABP0JLM2_9DINO